MAMTQAEKVKLVLQRAEARAKLKEIRPTRDKLKMLSRSYDMIFCRAYMKFVLADERLAKEEKLTVLPPRIPREYKPRIKRSLESYSAEELLHVMNRDQLQRIHDLLSEEVMKG